MPILLILLFWPLAAQAAFTSDYISLHGFGGWAYGRTDNENRYLMGTEDGCYDHVYFSLNMSANPFNNFHLHVQSAFNESMDGQEVVLDYGFADYYISDKLSIMIGKIKTPFMFYNEIYDVGTLRPFYTLAQGIYYKFAAEAYQGLGLTGTFSVRQTWDFQYDIYGGKGELQPQRLLYAHSTLSDETAGNIVIVDFRELTYFGEDMFGARLMVSSPLCVLDVGLSYYSANVGYYVEDIYIEGRFQEKYVERYGRHHFCGISIAYKTPKWTTRMEYVGQFEKEEGTYDYFHTGYLETAFTLTEKLQCAARFEFEDTHEAENDSFEEHLETAVGLNYWLHRNFVVKVSLHHVQGNSMAMPDTLEDYITNISSDSFDDTTNLFVVGTQFSF
ncbi:hypothetical protein ACFL27_05800 [candidate division CSSED10-310 bacterium]|uniref:Porin n=1 Tax=candidate division CSSED10-310 bacterium TaxID=2855610 RepID=A0ABV6YUF1_UNCC1